MQSEKRKATTQNLKNVHLFFSLLRCGFSLFVFSFAFLFFTVGTVQAQPGGPGGPGGSCPAADFTIEGILKTLSCNLNKSIPLLVLLATVVFLWGVVRYITAGGDETKIEEARKLIVYGIIGLAVIVAVWGFVNVLINLIFRAETIPSIPGGDVVDTL